MRRAMSSLLVLLLTTPPVGRGATAGNATVRGVVTVKGRPLAGAALTLVELGSGLMRRFNSSPDGSFALRVQPGEYVVTTEGAGLIVGRAPTVIRVAAGDAASADIDLMPLPLAAMPRPSAAPLTIDHTAVGCLVAGEYPLIEAGIEPVADVAYARVYFKSILASGYFFVEASRGEVRFAGKLPRPKVEASPIEYYVSAAIADGTEVKTSVYSAAVVESKEQCPEGKLVAPVGPTGAVAVFSAATGAAVSPAGFTASGITLGVGILTAFLTGAAAVVSAKVDVFNPSPKPPLPPSTPTPTPEPTPIPTPGPTPTPLPTPKPTPCPHPPWC